jgi:hypothetical protein
MSSEASPAVPGDTPAPAGERAPGRELRAALLWLRVWINRAGWAILRRSPAAGGIFLVALVGGILGAELAPATTASIGPLQARVRVVPSLHPGVHLLLPPAGQVDFATHVAPVAIEGQISQVDLEGARTLIGSPAQVRALGDTAGDSLRSAVIRAALTTIGCGTLGAVALSLLVYRRVWRRTAQVAATLVGTLVVTGTMAGVSADPERLAQPRFTGLLSQAPYIAGQVPDVLQRLETYRSGLADIVKSVTALYATAGGLSGVGTSSNDDVVTVLHVSDVHLNPLAFDLMDRLIAQFGVDAVLDTGDITTWGTDVETSTLSRIGELKVPYVFVRGNHDSATTEAAVRRNRNAVVLDDRVAEVAGLVIGGIGDPVFTPDSSKTELPGAGPPVLGPPRTTASTNSTTPTPTPTTTNSTIPSALSVLRPSATGSAGTGSAGTGSAGTGSAGSGSGGPSAASIASRPVAGILGPTGPQGESNTRLASTIEQWDAAHPDRPVQIAMVHEPYQLQPLMGLVPTIMAGHSHQRTTRLDSSGTRVLIEGSTGGAGITARGLVRLADGEPLPLAASLVYYARRGPRTGQVVAVDAITVGGFGLTSVNLVRTTVPAPAAPLKRPAGLPAQQRSDQPKRPDM